MRVLWAFKKSKNSGIITRLFINKIQRIGYDDRWTDRLERKRITAFALFIEFSSRYVALYRVIAPR